MLIRKDDLILLRLGLCLVGWLLLLLLLLLASPYLYLLLLLAALCRGSTGALYRILLRRHFHAMPWIWCVSLCPLCTLYLGLEESIFRMALGSDEVLAWLITSVFVEVKALNECLWYILILWGVQVCRTIWGLDLQLLVDVLTSWWVVYESLPWSTSSGFNCARLRVVLLDFLCRAHVLCQL